MSTWPPAGSSLGRRGEGLVFVEPKTPRSRRTVHLTRLAADALAEQARWQQERGQAQPALAGSGLVFTNLSGGPIEPGNVNANLSRLLVGAGLPRIRVHDLRHTTATTLLEAGVHPKVVQDLLGHSTIAITLDTYSHVAPTLHLQAVSELQRLLAGASATMNGVLKAGLIADSLVDPTNRGGPPRRSWRRVRESAIRRSQRP